MKLTTILFDLDGTLLPMDQDHFLNLYFDTLAKTMASHGYDPEQLLYGVWKGIMAMIENDGSLSNEDAFWNCVNEYLGRDVRQDEAIFNHFYENEFIAAKAACGFDPRSAEILKTLREKGFRLVLATNPLYPSIATETRARWAGLDVKDFDYYTVYDNSCHCKPNPAYYQDVCDAMGVSPEECLMVGNDAAEDTPAEQIGIRVFLLTDCLINKKGRDISGYPQGSLDDLMKYIDTL